MSVPSAETPAVADAHADLELLRSAAVAAGILAAGYFRRPLRTWAKDNASPVTEADHAVDRQLSAMLRAARPDYGWLSEESTEEPDRLAHAAGFVVDPIDGTRGFIQGQDSWTICLAVVARGVPVAGVVYAPARDELYDAVRGGGARLNGKPLEKRARQGRGPVIPAPGAVHTELQNAGLDYVRGPYLPSLAYRLVQVATGVFDAAVARRGARDWDIAAVSAILGEAGVGFEDVCSGPPRFDRADARHGALAAVADASLRSPLHAALVEVYGCPRREPGEERGT